MAPLHGMIEVYIPSMDVWDGTMLIVNNPTEKLQKDLPTVAHLVDAGLVFDDGIMRVTAVPNTHLEHITFTKCLSFSYIIECEGKRLVYSGDVGKYEDLDEILEKGCDGLIIETGPFPFEQACDYCKNKEIGNIFFSHNGRTILNNLTFARERIKALLDRAMICEDGMSVIL